MTQDLRESSARIAPAAETEVGPQFATQAAFPLAALVALASLGGILLPDTYAHETRSWAAQGIAQDWFDLVVVAPWLALTAAAAERGSRRAELLLGGGLVYTAYSFVLYTFVVHFNALFLVYCATLGLSLFALASLAASVLRADVRGWFDRGTPVKLAGGVLVALALVFAAMWLAEIVPALLSATAPRSVAENGMFTNPVHVLDLSILLPLLVVGGVSLWRWRPLGFLLAPFLLAFSVLMAPAIGVMVLFMRARGLAADLAVPAVFAVIAIVLAAVLVRLLAHVSARR